MRNRVGVAVVMALLMAVASPAYAGLFGGPCNLGNLDQRLKTLKKNQIVNCSINNIACMVTTNSWPASYSQATKDAFTAAYNAYPAEIASLEAMSADARKSTCYTGTVYNA